jgi:hypothetical protein
LTNYFDGQGYRPAMQQQRGPIGAHQAFANQRNNAGSSTRGPGSSTRGHVGARHAVGLGRQPYDTTFSSSPGDHTTLHYGPTRSYGTASGGQAQYAAFAAGVRGASIAPRTQGNVSLAQSAIPSGPSAAPRAQGNASRSQGTASRAKADAPRGRRQGNAPPQKFSSLLSMPSTMQQQEQKQKDDLLAAAKAGDIGDQMVRFQGDFPGVATLKLLIIDGAIDHSNPSGPVLRMHSEHLNVFHATRVWLVDLAFDLAGLDDDQKVSDKLEILRATVSQRFEKDLYNVVLQAQEDVATKPHATLQSEYRLAGKLDILEMAMALHLSTASQNGKLPFQSNLCIQKTDTIITAQPTVDETAVTTSDAVVAPPAEVETTAPVLLDENAGTVSRDLDVGDLDMPDVATDVEVPALPVNDPGAVSNDPVGDTTQPAAMVSTQDVPGIAALHFSDGKSEHGPLNDALPPGLIVNVFMTFNSDHHKHLKDSDIYLGAFSEMVAAFHRLVNEAKATEDDGDSDAAVAGSDSDAAAESDDSAHTGASGFGTDASYKLIRSPAHYTGDTSDSDEEL